MCHKREEILIGDFRGESEILGIKSRSSKCGYSYNMRCGCGESFIAKQKTILENRPLGCPKCRNQNSTLKDLSTKIFNGIIVISYAGLSSNKSGTASKHDRMWNVKCRCGNDFKAREVHLLECKDSFGCKSCRSNIVSARYNLEGQKFNRLFAVIRLRDEKDRFEYGCICDCGNICTVNAQNLKRGKTKSCGCHHKETMGKLSGENSPTWKIIKSPITPTNRGSQSELLRKEVFSRDSHTCVLCQKRGGSLNCHHLDGHNWCEEKRLDKDNCITLCSSKCSNKGLEFCHDEFHKIYGKGDNTKEEFLQFCLFKGKTELYNHLKSLDKEVTIDFSKILKESPCPV